MSVDKYISVDASRCPVCGTQLVYQCYGDESTATCLNGPKATRRLPNRTPPCDWEGAPIHRLPDGELVIQKSLVWQAPVGEAASDSYISES